MRTKTLKVNSNSDESPNTFAPPTSRRGLGGKMSDDWSVPAMNAMEPTHTKRSDDLQMIVHRLNALAVKRLVSMFDPEKQLFCYKLKQTATGLVREGISPRYTAIALMGLHRLEQSGLTPPIEIKDVFDVLMADTEWVDNIGDLGLLLWLCALVAPDRLDEVDRRLDIKSA